MSTIPLGFRRNKNGFAVFPVHYSMDPEKATPEWAEREKKGMPGWMWRKEYEMDPYAASGKPAFPDLNQWKKHIYLPLDLAVPGGIIPDWWPRYAGFDWGSSNPTALEFATVRPDGVIVFYWELYRKNLTPNEIDATAKAHPDWRKIVFVAHDPSMVSMTPRGGGISAGQKNAEEKALADIFALKGWSMVPGTRGDDVTFVQNLYAAWANLEKPRVIITHSCPNLYWELEHLRHDELNTTQLNKKNVPEKLVDKDNHAFDAIKYLLRMNPQPPTSEDEWDYLSTEEKVQTINPRPREEIIEDPYLGALA